MLIIHGVLLVYFDAYSRTKFRHNLAIKYSIRETFATSKDLEIIAISVNVNIPTLACAQAVREGMFLYLTKH